MNCPQPIRAAARCPAPRAAALALAAAMFLPPPEAPAADWPQLQCDAAHTGSSPDQPNPPYKLLWTRDLGEPMAPACQPVVADGRLYVGTDYGNLYALGNVLAQHWVLGKTGDAVARYVDTTRFLGDLYHVRNLAAAIQSYSAAK